MNEIHVLKVEDVKGAVKREQVVNRAKEIYTTNDGNCLTWKV